MDLIHRCEVLMKKRDVTYNLFSESVYMPTKQQLLEQFLLEFKEHHRQRGLLVERLNDLERQMCEIQALEVNGYEEASLLFVLPEELLGVIGTFLSGKRIRSLQKKETQVGSIRRMIHEDAQMIREYLSQPYSLSLS